MARSLVDVDWSAADLAADRIALAYEVADALSDYGGDTPERRLSGITIAHVTTSFSLIDLGVTEKQASSEFAKAYRAARRVVKRLGSDVRLREVLTELHLDQRK